MSPLVALLSTNALVHAIVVARFGIRGNNEPFFLFALVNAALAIAVSLGAPYALWGSLILSIIGITGLTITFNKPIREKNLDKIIWLLDAATILLSAFLLFRS